jgi:hypothetical protein
MTRAIADLITVPAQARPQIGELASYLERALRNVKAVDGRLPVLGQTEVQAVVARGQESGGRPRDLGTGPGRRAAAQVHAVSRAVPQSRACSS